MQGRSVENPIVNTGKSPDYLFWMTIEEIAYAFMEKKKSSIIIIILHPKREEKKKKSLVTLILL